MRAVIRHPIEDIPRNELRKMHEYDLGIILQDLHEEEKRYKDIRESCKIPQSEIEKRIISQIEYIDSLLHPKLQKDSDKPSQKSKDKGAETIHIKKSTSEKSDDQEKNVEKGQKKILAPIKKSDKSSKSTKQHQISFEEESEEWKEEHPKILKRETRLRVGKFREYTPAELDAVRQELQDSIDLRDKYTEARKTRDETTGEIIWTEKGEEEKLVRKDIKRLQSVLDRYHKRLDDAMFKDDIKQSSQYLELQAKFIKSEELRLDITKSKEYQDLNAEYEEATKYYASEHKKTILDCETKIKNEQRRLEKIYEEKLAQGQRELLEDKMEMKIRYDEREIYFNKKMSDLKIKKAKFEKLKEEFKIEKAKFEEEKLAFERRVTKENEKKEDIKAPNFKKENKTVK